MARYHFNLRERSGLVEDEEGRELAGMEEVRAEALRGVRSVVAEDVLQGRVDLSGVLEVVDSEGRSVFSLPFRDAVDIQF